MSCYYCEGCDTYRESREHGYHETESGAICDECESLVHDDMFRHSMNLLEEKFYEK